ncbi:MAG: tetratricopeptide (TPR) repeat protein [Gammaproteobacteria bacterium]|jgi:tetratricopeptide (TPR) repeat protein
MAVPKQTQFSVSFYFTSEYTLHFILPLFKSFMTSKLNSLIESGITAQQSGKLNAALEHYQSAFVLAPEDAEVLSLLGLVLCQLDRLDEAEPLLREAVEREPKEFGFRMNLAEFLKRKDLLKEAENELMGMVSHDPGFSPAWDSLGDIATLQEDKTSARTYYQKAFSSALTNFTVGLKLVETHLALKEYSEALRVLESIAKDSPDNPALFNFTCITCTALRDWLQLEVNARKWLSALPNDPLAWQMLSSALMEQGQYRQAEESYRNVLAIRSENAEDLSLYGQICLRCFEYEKAKNAFEKAKLLHPDRLDLLISLSLYHTLFGELEEAESYSRRALQIDPACVAAYIQLGHISEGKFSDEEMDCLARLLTDSEQAEERRIDLAFTLGRAYEVKGKYKLAYEAYDLANRLNRDMGKTLKLIYDKNESSNRTQQIKALYRPDGRHQSLADASPCPIFIVGMPRSGTTLIESTIAAHSKVFAGGERPLLPQLHNSALSFSLANGSQLAANDTLEEWVDTYLSDLPDLVNASYFTDKNPLNIETVGLIAVLFPNAPIIHIRRNPLETCFSIFKHKFSKFWTFTHSLSDIAHFYGEYAQLVSHWEHLLGDRFLTLQYEEFATNFSTMAPELIKHCGLEWESQCLDFQKESRAISTLSAVQIRKQVKASPAITGYYKAFMGLLSDELLTAGVDLDTGALLDDSLRE